MNKTRSSARLVLTGSCALVLAACGPGQDDMEMGGMEMGGSEQGEVQEFAFTGVVQSVDTTTGIVSVANDEIPGWMMAMTMNYYLEPPDAIATLEAGDRITATVYSGDVQHLYDVQRVENP